MKFNEAFEFLRQIDAKEKSVDKGKVKRSTKEEQTATALTGANKGNEHHV